ncbi:cyclin-like protein [Piedraia hortae CBS 480.64]|uniref:Transcription initiation factor IIB n=1 Tax=Piedraia hortae CBS 480.64 TaxID=1314780 RepID=A0A6A7BZ95_9PEZI|nr:cyclin-like protein [Piedraia hortae CBS 480.64]
MHVVEPQKGALICKQCLEDPSNLAKDDTKGDTTCGRCGIVLSERGSLNGPQLGTAHDNVKERENHARVDNANDPQYNNSDAPNPTAIGDGVNSPELPRTRNKPSKQNKSSAEKNSRGLTHAYKHITSLCDRWDVPNTVTDTAKHLYKESSESLLFRGKNQESLMAGCIFLACRQNNVPRSFREIMELTKISKKEIGKTFKLLESFLLQNSLGNAASGSVVSGGTAVPSETYKGSVAADPADLCNRYCKMLNMDQETTDVATELARRITSVGVLAGRSPLSSAATCIFMASHLMDQPKTAKEIMVAARVSDSTIRQAYKVLYHEKDALLSEKILDHEMHVSKLPPP